MPLAPGTQLGPYEIQSPLGAGGMGEVYRARDTRLERTVAIKILPAHLCSDPAGRQRFEREAKTISNLNHPHICVLHDVGQQNGIDYIVMECVEGETLAARLEKGPLPLDQALRYGAQIADALDKAHRCGVVHRDLTPRNVMITCNGAKLLDFGLAKPCGAMLSQVTLTALPVSPVTQEGAIIGTIQYMSPEQIEGKELDGRSDIFSLGAVLYEMLSGQKAFEGKSQLSVASAILEKEPPPILNAKPMTPAALEHVVKKCVAKSPDERWQSAGDLASELRWVSGTSGQAAIDPALGRASKATWQRTATLATLITLAATVLVLAFLQFTRSGASGDQVGIARLTIPMPPKQELSVDTTQAVALSPDGKRLAYVAATSGVSHLYVRRLDRYDSVAIPDSEGATFPFFSPNGDWVAFFNQGKIRKAPSDGGLPVEVCQTPSFFGGTWTPQDIIVLSVPNFGLATVPATGGTMQKISVPSRDKVYPQGLTWLAGGDWVMFTDYFSARWNTAAVKLSTGELRPLLDNVKSPSYSVGHLIYYQGGTLWAVPFDPDKLKILGNAFQVESGINESNYLAQVSVSRNGMLAYAAGPAGNIVRNLCLVNRKGEERKLDVGSQDYVDPSFSPDGKRIAVIIRTGTAPQQLEVLDSDRGSVTSFARGFSYVAPAWTSDGKSLLFDARDANGQNWGIYRVAGDGSSEVQLLRPNSQASHVTSIAGDTAVVSVNDPVTNVDLWLMNLRSPYEMQPFKHTNAIERQGSLSPDGHWVAYASDESGRSEVYVEPVPGPGGRRQISSDGGEEPRWVRNGREIVYRNGTKMMSAAVHLQPSLSVQKAVELFDHKFERGATVAGYDVSPDGQSFVMTRAERENPTEIRVVINWLAVNATPK
jgi:serine/threonine protein kinase